MGWHSATVHRKTGEKSIHFSINLYYFLLLSFCLAFCRSDRVFCLEWMKCVATHRPRRGWGELMKCSFFPTTWLWGAIDPAPSREMEKKSGKNCAETDFTWPIAILRRERWATLFAQNPAQKDRSFTLYLVTILSESTWFHSKKPLQNYFNFFCQRSSWHRRFPRYFPQDSAFSTDHFISPLVPPSTPFPTYPTLFTPRPTHIAPIESRADWHACCSITRSHTSGLLLSPLSSPRKNANIPIVLLLPSVSSSVFLDIIP